MATFKVNTPDGKTVDVDAPEGATPEQAIEFVAKTWKPSEVAQQFEEQKPSMPWSEVPKQAIQNFPSSLGKQVTGIAEAVRHPIQTTESLMGIARGGMQKLLPESVTNFAIEHGISPESRPQAEAFANFYKQRYGTEEGFKNALATDPAGVMADLSTLLSGVGGQIGKVGRAIEPLSATAGLAGKGITGAGKVIGGAIGGLGTRTGVESLPAAARAGLEGGKKEAEFIGHMRGSIPMMDVLDQAKAGLQELNRVKGEEYRTGMAGITNDKSVLDMSGIDDAVKKAYESTTFKGEAKNPVALESIKKIQTQINKWKKLDPAEFHTPEGLDALKQRVYAEIEKIPFENKAAHRAAKEIYNSIKDEIEKQAGDYADVMRGYTEASDQIHEIERALSLGQKASAEAGLRKLQSITRNNAMTNFGSRAEFGKVLEGAGQNNLISNLYAQSLSTPLSRGIGGAFQGATTGLGFALGGYPGAVATAALQSPRLMGEAALKTGQAARLAKKPTEAINKLAASMGVSPSVAANLLYQSGAQNQRSRSNKN
ncbi:MAG: hypothetical protein M0P59_15320 [Gallionella sp.]|jgi:hypothetical protein|nr:hypothetical protein [Gallionella sp.]